MHSSNLLLTNALEVSQCPCSIISSISSSDLKERRRNSRERGQGVKRCYGVGSRRDQWKYGDGGLVRVVRPERPICLLLYFSVKVPTDGHSQ
jgi:hypothetical protein